MNDEYNLKGNYRDGQTPQERLNNLLTPFFTLADIINTKSFSDPSKDASDKSKKLYEIIKECAQICSDNKDFIRNYLHDIPTFYKKEIDSE